MAIVAVVGMKFYAFHGYYEFERRVGDYFELDVQVELGISEDPQDKIENTIDYEEIYRVSEKYMTRKYRLLESLAYDIAYEIKSDHPRVVEVEVRLSKLNPKLGAKTDRAMIILKL